MRLMEKQGTVRMVLGIVFVMFWMTVVIIDLVRPSFDPTGNTPLELYDDDLFNPLVLGMGLLGWGGYAMRKEDA